MVQDSTGYAQTANQLGVDPLFVNLTAHDFHLQSTSPAIGTGTAAAVVTVDYDGLPRTGSLDVGSYQHTGTAPAPAPAPTPVLQILTSTLASARLGSPYSQTLSASAPCVWAVTGGMLPPGLSLNPTRGVIAGVPSPEGTWAFVVQASTSQSIASASLSIRVKR